MEMTIDQTWRTRVEEKLDTIIENTGANTADIKVLGERTKTHERDIWWLKGKVWLLMAGVAGLIAISHNGPIKEALAKAITAGDE